MRIAIRADASETMGAGHVMRCLALADALRSVGGSVSFFARSVPDFLADRIRQSGHSVVKLADDPAPVTRPGRQGPATDGFSADDEEQDALATLGAAKGERFDWWIVDHYRLGRRWEERVRDGTNAVLVIDDLADREHDCDLLLDQTVGRAADDYRDLVPRGAGILTGARYALLRRDFADARPAALARRRTAGPPEDILVSLGASDVGGHSVGIVRGLVDAGVFRRIDVVLSSLAASRAAVAQVAAERPDVHLHVDSSDIAALMVQADLAIGAGGISTWERCCLGLPAIALVVADNQRFSADQLGALGAALPVSGEEQAVKEAVALRRDPEKLASMSAAAAAISDGLGAQRVAAALAGASDRPNPSVLRLRAANATDTERVWLWRNDPHTRQMAKVHDPVPWRAHTAWFADRLSDPACHMFIAELGDQPSAIIRFDGPPGGIYTVSITVSPDARGTGTGRRVLEHGCELIQRQDPNATLRAEILESNRASRRIFTANGFVPTGATDVAGYEVFERAPPARP